MWEVVIEGLDVEWKFCDEALNEADNSCPSEFGAESYSSANSSTSANPPACLHVTSQSRLHY